VASKFAIGDALILDIDVRCGAKYGSVGVALERCSADLESLGYSEYSAVHNLRDWRLTAKAFDADHRADILETFPHIAFSVFLNCREDPTILDDLVEAMERNVDPIRIPKPILNSVRRKRTVTVTDVAQIKRHLKSVERSVADDSMPSPPVEVFDITDSAARKAARDRHPSVGSLEPRPPATKSYTNKEFAEMRRQADEEALAASETPESVDATEDGFTYVIHATGGIIEQPERKATVDQLLALLEDAKSNLYEFLRAWANADLRLDDAIEVLEALDSVRVAWERSHEMISGYSPEMH
jgi:hypothetical protein